MVEEGLKGFDPANDDAIGANPAVHGSPFHTTWPAGQFSLSGLTGWSDLTFRPDRLVRSHIQAAWPAGQISLSGHLAGRSDLPFSRLTGRGSDLSFR